MLKFPRHRRGLDAKTFWLYSGAKLLEEEGLSLEWNNTGVILLKEGGFQLEEGVNLIPLPCFVLDNVILSVTPAMNVVANEAVINVLGGGLYGPEDAKNGLWLKIVCRAPATISALAHLHLLSDR